MYEKKLLFCLFILSWCYPVFASDISTNSITYPLELVNPKDVPQFIDDGNLKEFRKSIQSSLSYYSELSTSTTFAFGKDEYRLAHAVESLRYLNKFLKRKRTAKKLNQVIQKNFLLYRSIGIGPEKKATFSSYFEPTLSAVLEPDSLYQYPLYARPPELVDVRLEQFDPKKKGERISGRVQGKFLVPYYTRREIDSQKVLQARGLEIAWAKNPLDILILQIQGSGRIEIPNSTQTYKIRYAGDNSHPYRSVGLYLIQSGILPKETFSKAKMIEYLNNQTPEKRQEILNQNPRFIFFELTSATVPVRGSLGVPLIAGRSIASDPKFYPLGALAWIETEQPVFDAEWKMIGRKPLKRFVLNHDEGGAIKGTGRIDFFSGHGIQAEKTAENLWFPGDLYFLIKKSK